MDSLRQGTYIDFMCCVSVSVSLRRTTSEYQCVSAGGSLDTRNSKADPQCDFFDARNQPSACQEGRMKGLFCTPFPTLPVSYRQWRISELCLSTSRDRVLTTPLLHLQMALIVKDEMCPGLRCDSLVERLPSMPRGTLGSSPSISKKTKRHFVLIGKGNVVSGGSKLPVPYAGSCQFSPLHLLI